MKAIFTAAASPGFSRAVERLLSQVGAPTEVRPERAKEAVMPTFVLRTRLSPEAVHTPGMQESQECEAMRRIRAECPGVEWVHNCAVFGPYDHLDIFRAPDVETAARVAALIRIHGPARAETWAAVEWDRFKALGEGRPPHAGRELTPTGGPPALGP